jgi:hypothetical protein
MVRDDMQFSILLRAFALASLSLLTSCGGGSSPNSTSEELNNTPQGEVSGYIMPVPQAPGLITIIGSSGEIGNISTDSNGHFVLDAQLKSGSYQMKVEHQGFTEFSGARSSSGSYNISFEYIAGEIQSVFGTTFSRLADIGSSTEISNWLGFNPLRTQPAVLNDANFSSDSLSSQIKHGALTQAISVLSKNLGREDTEALTDLMVQDYSADGSLDGLGAGGIQLSYNGEVVSNETYRRDLGVALLEVLQDERNVTGVTGQAAVDYANEFANSLSSVAPALDYTVDVLNPIDGDGGEVTPPETGPYSFQFAGPTQFGTVRVQLVADDINTVSTFYINSTDYTYFTEATYSNNAYFVDIDTTQFSDGVMGFEISIDKTDGTSFNADIEFNINNSTESISLVSDLFTNNYNYTAVVETDYDSADILNVLINNQNATLSSGKYSAVISLGSNANQVTVIVNLRSGLSDEAEFTVSVDDSEPTVDEVFHEFTSGYKVNYYKPADGVVVNQYLYMGSSYPFFLTDGSASLNFIDPTIANLKAKKHVFLQAKVSDNYSEYSDISVSYDALINGSGVAFNKPVTIESNGEFAIPVTVETFTDSLKTNNMGDTFTLSVKATDGAGNVSVENFTFNVRYEPYNIQPSTSYPDNSVVAGNINYIPGGYFSDAAEVSINVNGLKITAAYPTSPSFNFSTSTLTDGVHTFTITVKTIFGETYTHDITLDVDNTKPVIDIDAVVEASSSSYVLTGRATDLKGINSIKVDGQSVSFNSETGEFSKTITLSTGVQYVEVVAEDNTYNKRTVTVEISYDPTKPQIQVVSPYNTLQKVWVDGTSKNQLSDFYLNATSSLMIFEGNKNYNGLSLNENSLSNNRIPHAIFEIKETNLSGVDQAVAVTMTVAKNGVPFITDKALAATSGFSYLIPFTEEMLGTDWFVGSEADTFTFTLKAVGQSKQNTYEFFLATKETTNVVSNPVSAQDAYNGLNENFFFQVGDIAGLTKSELFVNGVSYISGDPLVSTFLVDLSGLADGVYPLNLVLSDRAGERLNESMSFTVDRTAPTFTHNLPDYSKDFDFTVEGVVADLGVGVDKLYIDGELVDFNSTTGAYSHQIQINPNAGNIENDDSYESLHEFEIIDNIGNTRTETVQVKVDRVGSFVFKQSVTVTGQADTQCDGIPDVAKVWYGDDTNGQWTIYNNTKTLGAIDVTDNSALNAKDIGYFRFYSWSYSRDHHGDLKTLTDVTYSYYVDNVPVFVDQPLASVGLVGMNEVNEYRIALTEEYLGTGFYQTTTSQLHKLTVKAKDDLGHSGSKDFTFRVCNYVDKGIDR